MSAGLADVTVFAEAVRIETDDPYLIQVLAPIESETADEAVRRAQVVIADALAAIVGDADADHDTLGKLAALIEGARLQLATILAGANPAIDTFIEAYNRFLAGETAAAAMQAAIGQLQTAVSARLVAASNLADVPDPAAALANLNGLDRRVLAKAGDPVAADVPAGTIRAAKNTTTGRLTLWANDGGTMIDLLTL